MAELEVVHQFILWSVYWEGHSLRQVASNWETDELNVIREHKVILGYMQKLMAEGKAKKPIKIRPGLKPTAEKLKQEGAQGPFSKFLKKNGLVKKGASNDRR